MGYPSKIQCIKRKTGWRQFYLNLPAALAEALDCEEGESWAFPIVDRKTIQCGQENDPGTTGGFGAFVYGVLPASRPNCT